MANLWIFSLEPLEQRYTGEWFSHVPKLLTEQLSGVTVYQIDGIQNNTELTPGAFLNFSDTNYWKSSQLCAFLELYNKGLTTDTDQFLFTDAWNPVILQLRYMNDLLGLKWRFHGLWHAGSYDQYDALGRLIGDKPWVKHTELGLFDAFDHNYFATDFHIDLFIENCLGMDRDIGRMNYIPSKKIVKTGWPMEYMTEVLAPYRDIPKKNQIVFPHRIAPEKQIDIFRDLANSLPQYEWVVCQDQQLTKEQYHRVLAESKLMFSAAKQETLGISCLECPLLNVIPLVPDRLSYSNLFENDPMFLYPPNWTANWGSYLKNKEILMTTIMFMMNNYDTILPTIQDYIERSIPEYFHADVLINTIRENIL